MDLVTQAVLGAVLAQATAPARETRVAALAGGAAAMLADADALIGRADDPLLVLEYHRHFSHALAFAPLGALLAALLLWPLLRHRLPPARLYAYTLLGYLTAGLLDACTSYGTHLWWPFTDGRVAWNIIAIVDPLFTLPLLGGLALGLWRRRAQPARAALALAAAYLLLAIVQQARATAAARAAISARGAVAERLIVKPTIGNLVLWRAVWVGGGRVHADGVHAGATVRVYPGASAPLLDVDRDLGWAPPGSRARRDAQRFLELSDGVVTRSADGTLGDARYATLPTAIAPLWGIALDPTAPDAPPRFVTDRRLSRRDRDRFLAMLLGRDLRALHGRAVSPSRRRTSAKSTCRRCGEAFVASTSRRSPS